MSRNLKTAAAAEIPEPAQGCHLTVQAGLWLADGYDPVLPHRTIQRKGSLWLCTDGAKESLPHGKQMQSSGLLG